MKKIKISLIYQILISSILGIIIGILLHNKETEGKWIILNIFNPASKLFMNLINMIVIPTIISTLIVGICSIKDIKTLGRISIKTIIYFEIVTTLAIIVGITVTNIFKPGHGINILTFHNENKLKYKNIIHNINNIHYNIAYMLLSLVPKNIFNALSNGEILPIIFFSILFGLSLSSITSKSKKILINIFDIISKTMFKMTNIIMYYAPIGIFTLITITITKFGLSSFLRLIKLVGLVYITIIFFILVILGIIARLCKLKITKIILILKEELIIAYSTSSSETVLPKIIKKMNKYGAPKIITNFVIPTGYSFNLDGSTLYQSIIIIFIAQLYNINLSIINEIILILTLMITSKGIAGVPGISFIVLLTTLNSIGLPTEGLAFIAGVDKIMDMARTVLNVIGNALAVLVISIWEKQFDFEKAKKYEKKLNI